MKTGYILVIYPDGSAKRVKTGVEVSLATLQKYAEGPIEAVPARKKGFVLIVNEEGKLRGMETNFIASLAMRGDDVIVGPAVILKSDGEELLPLSDEETRKWVEMLSFIYF